MKTNTELYAVAKSQLGNGGAKYRKYVGLSGGQPWCDAFVYWLFNANGCGELLPWKGSQRTYCPSSIQWCNKNLALIPPYLALPCDIIYFDWELNGTPNHIGIVKAKKSTSEIDTLEGNTTGKIKGKAVSGIVAEKTRNVKYVQGVYRPHFKASGLKVCKIAESGNFDQLAIYNMQHALKMSFNDGILGRATVKALQTKVGLKGKQIDGAWGKTTSLYTQRFLIKQGCLAKGGDDSIWGKQSTIALQKWINKQNNVTATKPTAPKPTVTPKPTPKPTPQKPTATAQGYTGAFPDLVAHSSQLIVETAKSLAYAKGTSKATYTYPKGHAKLTFQNAINKVYPNRSTWSKQCRAGASCDVGAGTIIRFSTVDPKIPRGLDEQIPYLAKSNRFKKVDVKKSADMKPGDVGVYIGKTKGAHIWISLGGKLTAEANHTAKYFEHIINKDYTNSNKKTWGVYRACVPTPISRDDRGTEVVKLQKFLNWFGGYGLATDGICGTKTENAIKDFQKKVGITVDGYFGSASLTKAKSYKKNPPIESVASTTQKVSKVVDVSYWQHTIDWKKASKEIDGAILRCSYTAQKSFTLSEDSTFLPNITGATQYGLKVGAYHYSQAISVDEAKKEAEYICKKLSGYKSKISLPVVIDWEFGGRLNSKKAKSLGKAKCTEIVSAFCEVVTGHGFTPMIYANYSTFSSYLDYPKLKKKYMIWLAQYSSKASLDYDYWQYTSSGSVNGISGKVDMNKTAR